MPTYDYRCKNCDSLFSVDKSMNDPNPKTCPSCSSIKINRVWSNIQLKGCEKGSSSGDKNCGVSCSGNCGSCGCG